MTFLRAVQAGCKTLEDEISTGAVCHWRQCARSRMTEGDGCEWLGMACY